MSVYSYVCFRKENEALLDVLIVGAGQAGLTMGYYLKQEGYNFLILEAGNRVGDSWRNRYDSLQLFTPREYSSLPGMVVKGEGKGFPCKDEMATYLEEYARRFKLPIQLQTEVFKIKKKEIYSNYILLQKFYKRKKLLSQQVAFSDRTSPHFHNIFHRMFFKYIHHNINHHHKFLRGKY